MASIEELAKKKGYGVYHEKVYVYQIYEKKKKGGERIIIHNDDKHKAKAAVKEFLKSRPNKKRSK